MSTTPALYELAAEYRDAFEQLADLELDPETVSDTLEGLRLPLEAKATNVVKFLRSLDSVADAIDEEAKRMTARSRAIRNRVESLKNYVLQAMMTTGVTRIESPWFVISTQQNPPAVAITDERSIPAKYVEQIVTTRIDKAAIKAAITAGETVPGAELTRGTRLAIR